MENNKRKRICFLPNRLMLGGIEMVLVDALKVLHDKYDVEIIIFVDEQCETILDRIPNDVKITLKQLPKNRILKRFSTIPFLSGFYFGKAIGKCHYDYLITLRPSVIQACFANKAKHKIYWSHNDFYKFYIKKQYSLKGKLKNYGFKLIYRQHDMIWTVSETIQHEIEGKTQMNNIYALPNPINCSEINRKATEECDLVFDTTKTNIVMIGRLSKEKGFDRVIRFMCNDVLNTFPNTHLYIMGGGGIEGYQDFINKFEHKDKVSLIGPKDNPFPYLKQAQLLVCPSRDESFGLVLLEAMLLKIPIITTDTVGGRYVTQNNTLGCCVKNSDASLQTAIENFLENKDNYRYSLDNAQYWAEQHDLKFFEKRILALLEECDK